MASQKPATTYIPSKVLETPYPLIDNDPHFKRVVGYSRTSDWLVGASGAIAAPTLFWAWEKQSPAYAGRGAFAHTMRLTGAMSLVAGFLAMYIRSSQRFYGMRENERERNMDMREMVAKVKAGEPLYGKTSLTAEQQGIAARQSRYSAMFMYVLPWFNFVNHNQHGVDTAKYYQQAERELEAERTGKLA